jgi:hypothetical protein
MADFDNAFAKLQKTGASIGYRRGTIPPKVVKTKLRPVYASLCSAYKDTTLEQRTDAYLFFETRDNLIEELSRFADDTAREASRHAKSGEVDLAWACVEHAVAADLMVDGRGDSHLIDQAQQHITKACTEINFDLDRYASTLDLKASAFSKAALRLHAEDQTLEAIQALGIALQMYPNLARHPKAMDLAEALTGKPADTAVALLRDRYERRIYFDEQLRLKDRKARRKPKQTPESNYWLITIVGCIVVGVLPPIAYPLVFGGTPDSSGVPSGLIVGTVTSAVFLMGRWKRRSGSTR